MDNILQNVSTPRPGGSGLHEEFYSPLPSPKDGSDSRTSPIDDGMNNVTGASATADKPTGHNAAPAEEIDLSEDLSSLGIGRRRWTRSQRKRLRILLDSGMEHKEAVAQVLQEWAEKPKEPMDQTKRKRSDDTTPPSRSAVTKKPKGAKVANPTPTEVGLKMAIVDKNHPATLLTREQLESIQTTLIQEIDKTVSQGGARLKFNGSYIRQGWLAIDCADETAKNWLVSLTIFNRLVEGTSVKVMQSSQMPKTATCTMWIPCRETAETESILKRIGHQNELTTSRWRLISVKTEAKGRTLVLSIDHESIEALKVRNMTVHHALTKFVIKIRTGPGKTKPKPKPKPQPRNVPTGAAAKPTVQKPTEPVASTSTATGSGVMEKTKPAKSDKRDQAKTPAIVAGSSRGTVKRTESTPHYKPGKNKGGRVRKPIKISDIRDP